MTSAQRSNRITLLQIVGVLGIGGTERQVVNLVRALDSDTFDTHLGCLARVGDFVKDVEAARVPLTEYRLNRLYNLRALRERLRLVQYIRRHQIQIVHTYGFYANVFGLPAARLAAPVVIASIRDNGDLLTPMQRRVQNVACRMAHYILTNADSVRRSVIAEGHNPDRVGVIRNGVDLAWVAGHAPGSQLRRELGLPPDVPVVALASRLKPRKGVEFFLEAAAIVARQFPNVRFLIVGDTSGVSNGTIVVDRRYRHELEDLAARLGVGSRVIFAGRRADVPGVLSGMSVSVLPSLSEGLPNVLLESMAAGVPVIATRVGGCPEVIEDGVTGLLVPPADSGALATAIGRVLADRDLASRLAGAAHSHVVAHFSLEKMVRDTERLYVDLLSDARPISVAARLGGRAAHS
jgi:glycosyltransferase involved in cell wall biosynthesis